MKEKVPIDGEEFIKRVIEGQRRFENIILENFDFSESTNFDRFVSVLEHTIFDENKGLEIVNSKFSYIKFINISLGNSKFINVEFENCLFKNTHINSCFFDNVKFEYVRIINSNFDDSLFFKIEMTFSDIVYSAFKEFVRDSKFINVSILYSDFNLTKFYNVSFENSGFLAVTFMYSTFENISIKNVRGLSNCVFGRTRISKKIADYIEKEIEEKKPYRFEKYESL